MQHKKKHKDRTVWPTLFKGISNTLSLDTHRLTMKNPKNNKILNKPNKVAPLVQFNKKQCKKLYFQCWLHNSLLVSWWFINLLIIIFFKCCYYKTLASTYDCLFVMIWYLMQDAVNAANDSKILANGNTGGTFMP